MKKEIPQPIYIYRLLSYSLLLYLHESHDGSICVYLRNDNNVVHIQLQLYFHAMRCVCQGGDSCNQGCTYLCDVYNLWHACSNLVPVTYLGKQDVDGMYEGAKTAADKPSSVQLFPGAQGSLFCV